MSWKMLQAARNSLLVKAIEIFAGKLGDVLRVGAECKVADYYVLGIGVDVGNWIEVQVEAV